MEENIKLGIDLLWVRHKKVGGIESYIRNLLDGLMELEDAFQFFLIVSKDNAESFKKYETDNRFQIHVCEINSDNVWKRILWQNLCLGRQLKKLGIAVCFEPYYCKPILGTRNIKFITTIHDLQALHYPEYFSKLKVLWMKVSWWNSINTSKKIIAISNYVREDINKYYGVNRGDIQVIYNPVIVDKSNVKSELYIYEKYNVRSSEYFFTVSSLLPHKNINVLLDVMKKIKEQQFDLPNRLIVSGVGGKSKVELEEKIKLYDLEENVQLTPYINDSERNALYKYCRAFLFPSVFEGFGMPPIEAMLFGVPVVTTRKTCLEEVTGGQALYVNAPNCVDEWIKKLGVKYDAKDVSFIDERYDKKVIAEQYMDIFKAVYRG